MFRYCEAKSIVSKTKWAENWFGNDYNMNIYRGCTHGCIYCDSRSECYHIDDFDEILIKENALQLIEKELSSKRITGVVGTGSMSDPYNVYEKKLMLTRDALKLLNKYRFGVGICTKGSLVTRDIDILSDINKHSRVTVCMTITAAEDRVSKVIEPRAPASSERFVAIKELSDAGIYTGILMMPLLMGITGSRENISDIVEKAYESGAAFIYPSFGLSMRDGNREFLYSKLDEHYPGLSTEYEKKYGKDYICNIPDYRQISDFFKRECNKVGIINNMAEIIELGKTKVKTRQGSFFPNFFKT